MDRRSWMKGVLACGLALAGLTAGASQARAGEEDVPAYVGTWVENNIAGGYYGEHEEGPPHYHPVYDGDDVQVGIIWEDEFGNWYYTPNGGSPTLIPPPSP